MFPAGLGDGRNPSNNRVIATAAELANPAPGFLKLHSQSGWGKPDGNVVNQLVILS